MNRVTNNLYLRFDSRQRASGPSEWLCGDGVSEFVRVSLDSRGEVLTVERDSVGVIPLYYSLDAGVMHLATSLDLLMRNFSGRLTPNFEYLQGLWLDFYADRESTPFLEIHRLPPGARLIADSKGVVVREGELPRLEGAAVENAGAALREKIFETCRLYWPQGESLGVLLSGGFDSSSLVRSFATLGGERASELHSYSLDFHSGPECGREDLDLVLDGANWNVNILNAEQLGYETFEQHEQDPLLFYCPNLLMFKPLLEAAARARVKKVCSGFGGDDVFSFTDLMLAERFKRGHFTEVWARRAQMSFKTFLLGVTPPPLQLMRHRLRQLPRGGFPLEATAADRLKEKIFNYHRAYHRLSFAPHLKNTYAKLFLSGSFAFGLEQEQELAQAAGCRMSYPLLNRDLALFFLGLPHSIHTQRFDEKGLFREAMYSIVPETIRQKRSPQHFGTFVRNVMQRQQVKFQDRMKQLSAYGWSSPILDLDDVGVQKLNFFYNVIQRARRHNERIQKENQEGSETRLSTAGDQEVRVGP